MLPELRIHETGLVVTGSLGDRFVPWTDVTAVELTPSELVVEHRGRFDCRCDRSVIDDPEAVSERIERRRANENGDGDGDGTSADAAEIGETEAEAEDGVSTTDVGNEPSPREERSSE